MLFSCDETPSFTAFPESAVDSKDEVFIGNEQIHTLLGRIVVALYGLSCVH